MYEKNVFKQLEESAIGISDCIKELSNVMKELIIRNEPFEKWDADEFRTMQMCFRLLEGCAEASVNQAKALSVLNDSVNIIIEKLNG